MTDEHTDAGPVTASPESAEPDEDRVQVAFERALAYASELEERGVKVYNSLWASPEWLALLGAAAIYSKAFLETLAKHHADAVDDHLRTRPRKNGTTTEVQISIDGGTSAALVVTDRHARRGPARGARPGPHRRRATRQGAAVGPQHIGMAAR